MGDKGEEFAEHGVAGKIQDRGVESRAGEDLDDKPENAAFYRQAAESHDEQAHTDAGQETLPDDIGERLHRQIAAAVADIEEGNGALGNQGGNDGADGIPAGNQQQVHHQVHAGTGDDITGALGAVAGGVIVKTAQAVADSDNQGQGRHEVDQDLDVVDNVEDNETVE